MYTWNEDFARKTLRKIVLALGVSATAVFANTGADPQGGEGDVSKFMVIDCMLPGKVRRLGGGARYMSARRPIKTTAGDCEIRGGEYVAYDRASYATSLKVWLPEAQAGDPKAQTYVGEMFEKGLGTTPDYAAAVAWYTKAAEQNYSRAQMNLGSMYEQGLGVPADEAMALNWYRRATGLTQDDLVYSSEVEALETEVAELQEELSSNQALVADLQQNLSSSQQQLTLNQGQLDRAEVELEEMRFRAERAPELGYASADLRELEAQIAQKEQALTASRQENERLRSEQANQQRALTAQLNAADGDKSAYEAVLGVERQKIDNLELQVQQLNSSLESRQQELANSGTQIEALRRELAARNSAGQAERDASMAELDLVVQQQREALRNSEATISNLERELSQSQQSLSAGQSALESLERELTQDAQSATADGQARIAAERRKVAELETQVANLTQNLQLTQSNTSRSESQLASLEQQLAISRSEQASSEQAIADLTALIESRQAELEQKTLGASYLQRELEQQTQTLLTEREDFAQRERALREDLDLAQVEKGLLEQRLQDVQSQMAQYEQQLAASRQAVEAREQEIQTAQNEIAQLNSERTEMERETAMVAALRDKVSQQSVQLAEMKGQNEWLVKEQERLESDANLLQSQSSGLDSSSAVAIRGFSAPPVLGEAVSVPSNVKWGDYHALIIGNYAYSDLPDLATPANDVRALADVLKRRYGFKVQVLENASRYQILETLNSYRERLREDDNFLIYYAGHGALDNDNDRGHWLPVDAQQDSPTNWISNETISDYINTMSAKHIMVIADSCYSGTLARTVRPNLNTGRSKKQNEGLLKILASTPSRTALTSGGTQPVMDGGGGDHSIFAASLLSILRNNNGLLLSPDLFSEVHNQVLTSGANELNQEPAYDVIKNTGDMTAPFFFVPG